VARRVLLILEQLDRQLRIGPHIEARFFDALRGGVPTSVVPTPGRASKKRLPIPLEGDAMRVTLPQSAEYFSLRLYVAMPGNDYIRTATVANQFEEIALPDGICEDQVGVTARFTDHRSKEAGELIVVKEAIEHSGPSSGPDEPIEGNVLGYATRMPSEPPIEPILAEPAPSDMAVTQTPGYGEEKSWQDLEIKDEPGDNGWYEPDEPKADEPED